MKINEYAFFILFYNISLRSIYSKIKEKTKVPVDIFLVVSSNQKEQYLIFKPNIYWFILSDFSFV